MPRIARAKPCSSYNVAVLPCSSPTTPQRQLDSVLRPLALYSSDRLIKPLPSLCSSLYYTLVCVYGERSLVRVAPLFAASWDYARLRWRIYKCACNNVCISLVLSQHVVARMAHAFVYAGMAYDNHGRPTAEQTTCSDRIFPICNWDNGRKETMAFVIFGREANKLGLNLLFLRACSEKLFSDG